MHNYCLVIFGQFLMIIISKNIDKYRNIDEYVVKAILNLFNVALL